MAQNRKEMNELREAEKGGANVSADITAIKLSVIGMPPFDGPAYSLWTYCRHPNYFGEWTCWFAYTISAIPSVLEFGKGDIMLCGQMFLILFYTTRMFHDCLLFWTGAGPLEHA